MGKIKFSNGDQWNYKYGDHEIAVKVVVGVLAYVELIVDGKIQDAKNGVVFSADLQGKLPDGKPIKASIGGAFAPKCSVFVDYEQLELINKVDI